MGGVTMTISETQRDLIQNYQRGIPVSERPFADMARRLNRSQSSLFDDLNELQSEGVISRVGPVFAANRAGASTLAALTVPPSQLEAVAELVSGYDEVNHNYEREHEFNLWFVVTASDRQRIDAVLADISQHTGLEVLDLPMLEDFYIDLGFELQWI